MMIDLILIFISSLILVICVLVGVAFLTLLERKVLGYIQIRKGPNKVGVLGLIQPFSDAIKLFTKEQTYPFMSNFNLYYLSPVMNLFLALLLWVCIPLLSVNISFDLSMLYFLSISSLGVYSVMLAGWSSNSNYSLLGSLRAVAQTISYEVSLALILMSFLFMVLSLSILDLMKFQKNIWFLMLMLPLCFMWLVSSLAETNRTPFDFAEGESELVSGFNVEYSSGGFAMIFLAEYASILFMSFMCSMLFLGGDLLNLFFFIKVGLMGFLWIWVRGTLPRYRYDKLMYLAWKSYLPISLNYLLLFFSMKIFIFIFLI
uniref:NADH dehydrogenase subunit 1 n=1 Tax=Pseudoechthistatus chiangshunani TaxID=2976366 RepID=UPI0021B6BC3B|nr:NADH dehydrogenase subunit 1 [Pseudoechthistatus chiangshunani]UVW93779.1 NADH dehydrogenase subunit 1 [Pseudoechthistatus chiangshunani]